MKAILFVLTAVVAVLAGGSSVGNIKSGRSSRDIERMGSGYYDCRNLTIAADTVIIDSTYSGLMCISIKNETDDDMTIKFYTDTEDTTTKDITLPAYGHSGLLPSIHTILDTTAGSTGGKVTLYFWNLTN